MFCIANIFMNTEKKQLKGHLARIDELRKHWERADTLKRKETGHP
jgi:hypothetical protein